MSRAPVVSNMGKPHVDEQTEVCRTAAARIRSNQLVRTELISLDPFVESRSYIYIYIYIYIERER